MSDRKNTTMSGQPRIDESYSLRELLDDYGPMSMLQRFLHGHDDEIPAMPPGLGGLGFDVLSTDPDAPSMKDYQEYEQKQFDEIRKKRKQRDIDVSGGLGDIPDGESLRHYGSMRAGDDTLAYTQTGERIIPLPVLQNFPEIAAAVKQATAEMGYDPDRFEVGNEAGIYNPETGVQEFNHAWWHIDVSNLLGKTGDFLSDMGTKAMDTIKDTAQNVAKDPLGNDMVQAGLAGIGSGVAAKLAGADNKQALQTALGGAVGYGLSGVGADKPLTTAEKLLSGAMGAYGAYDSYVPPPPPLPQAPSNPLPSDYAQLLATQPVSYGAQNEQANLSMTLPQPTPPAVVGAQPKPEGVSYLEEVDTRDGGKRYVDKGKVYGGSFGSNISADSRRRDLSGFGKKVLYID